MADPFEPLEFDDTDAIEFDDSPIPQDDYIVQLEDFKTGTSRAGNPKVTWEFKVVENDEYPNRRIWHDTVTIGKGSGMFKAVISAFGYDANELIAEYGNQITFELLAGLVGERAEARVSIETPTESVLEQYPNAKPRNRIQRFLS